MRALVGFACIVAIVAAFFADRVETVFSNREQTSSNARTKVATAVPAPQPKINNSRSITLTKRSHGHFEADARVDGRRVDFLVDTGASHIALRESTAARLGIRPSPSEYTVAVATANGIARAAPVRLNVVELGDVRVRDVTALVQRDNALGVDLLGMSFLSRVRFSHERGKLIIEQ
jgi:aspartyl protease family protein